MILPKKEISSVILLKKENSSARSVPCSQHLPSLRTDRDTRMYRRDFLLMLALGAAAATGGCSLLRSSSGSATVTPSAGPTAASSAVPPST